MKRILSILLALAMMLTGLAAFAEDAAPEAEQEAPAAETAEAAEAEPQAGEAEATAEAEPALLVTVNGKEIREDDTDLNYWVSYYLYMLYSSGYDTSDASLLQEVNQYAMENTISFALLRQKAAEMGLDTMTEEWKAEQKAAAEASWTEVVENYEATYFGITDESSDDDKATARAGALAQLEIQGYTEESYVEEMLQNAEMSEIINRVRDEVTKDVQVTEEDALKYFNDLVKEDQELYAEDASGYEFATTYYGTESYYMPEGYRGITHILLKVDEELLNNWQDLKARLEEQQNDEGAEATTVETTEGTGVVEEGAAGEAAEAEATPEPTPEPVTQEMVDAAKQAILDSVQDKINEIMDKYNSGTSFEDLIVEYGTDPGMEDETTRTQDGYAVHKDSIRYISDFTNGAMTLEKVGDISEPIVSEYGVHILKYLRDIPGGAVEYTDELKAELTEALKTEAEQNKFYEVLDQWKAESKIEYTEAGEPWKLPEETAEETEAVEEEALTEEEAAVVEAAVEEAVVEEAVEAAVEEAALEETLGVE